jgi:YHS domain-containing protein
LLVTVTYDLSEIMFMKRLMLIVGFLALTSAAIGQASKSAKQNLDSDRLAIEGYDPVAYFKGKKAVEGKKELAHEYQGAVYRFSTQQNREAFIAAPSAYLPQYGGWCAYAMGATGEKVEVDPETFKIVDGKLYLFYNKFFNNTLETWNKNETALKSKADINWKSLTERNP